MTVATQERGAMLERRRHLAEQEDWIASATRAVELGRRARRAYLDRTQVRNLQRVGETGASVSAVLDYVKTQAGKHPQWRRENFGAVLLEELDRLAQRAGKDVSRLELCRLYLRQVAAAYVYSIAVDVAARPPTPPARPADAASRPPVPRPEPAGRPVRPAGPRPAPTPRAPAAVDAPAAADAQPAVDATGETPATPKGMPEQAAATVQDASPEGVVLAPDADETPVAAEPDLPTAPVAPAGPPDTAEGARPALAADAAPAPVGEESPGVLPATAAPAATETVLAPVAGTGPEAPAAEASPAGTSPATDAAETSADRYVGTATTAETAPAERAAGAVTDTESAPLTTQAPPEPPPPAPAEKGTAR